jgi:hypothetical protein
MKPKKLFVALPVYGGYDAFFAECLIKLIQAPPCSLMVRSCKGDSLVSRARNTLTAEFLATDCTHLFFIDTDLIFSPEHVERLVSHDKPIVAGLYPKKQVKLEWVINTIGEWEQDENGLTRVKYAGTGFLMIAREVVEAMIEAYPESRYNPDHRDTDEHDLWPVGVYEYPDGNRRYLSEDWYFCQRALDLGYDIYADCRVILKHVGQCIYPIQDPFDSAPQA